MIGYALLLWLGWLNAQRLPGAVRLEPGLADLRSHATTPLWVAQLGAGHHPSTLLAARSRRLMAVGALVGRPPGVRSLIAVRRRGRSDPGGRCDARRARHRRHCAGRRSRWACGAAVAGCRAAGSLFRVPWRRDGAGAGRRTARAALLRGVGLDARLGRSDRWPCCRWRGWWRGWRRFRGLVLGLPFGWLLAVTLVEARSCWPWYRASRSGAGSTAALTPPSDGNGCAASRWQPLPDRRCVLPPAGTASYWVADLSFSGLSAYVTGISTPATPSRYCTQWRAAIRLAGLG